MSLVLKFFLSDVKSHIPDTCNYVWALLEHVPKSQREGDRERERERERERGGGETEERE